MSPLIPRFIMPRQRLRGGRWPVGRSGRGEGGCLRLELVKARMALMGVVDGDVAGVEGDDSALSVPVGRGGVVGCFRRGRDLP